MLSLAAVAARRASHMSIREVASLLGMSAASYNRIEMGLECTYTHGKVVENWIKLVMCAEPAKPQ